jgi:hypothetical protein
MKTRIPLGQYQHIQAKSPLGSYTRTSGERLPLGVAESTINSTFPVFQLALKEQEKFENSSWNESFEYNFESSLPTEQPHNFATFPTRDDISNLKIPDNKSKSTAPADIQAFPQQSNSDPDNTTDSVIQEVGSTFSIPDVNPSNTNISNLSDSQTQIQAQGSPTATAESTPISESLNVDSSPALVSSELSIQPASTSSESDTEMYDEPQVSQSVARESETTFIPNISEPVVQLTVESEQVNVSNSSTEDDSLNTDFSSSSVGLETTQRMEDNSSNPDPRELSSSTETELTEETLARSNNSSNPNYAEVSSTETELMEETRVSPTETILESAQENTIDPVQSSLIKAYNPTQTEVITEQKSDVNSSEHIQLKTDGSIDSVFAILADQSSETPETHQDSLESTLELSSYEHNPNRDDYTETPEVQLAIIDSSEFLRPGLPSSALPNQLENQEIENSPEYSEHMVSDAPASHSGLLNEPLENSPELLAISDASPEPQVVQLSLNSSSIEPDAQHSEVMNISSNNSLDEPTHEPKSVSQESMVRDNQPLNMLPLFQPSDTPDSTLNNSDTAPNHTSIQLQEGANSSTGSYATDLNFSQTETSALEIQRQISDPLSIVDKVGGRAEPNIQCLDLALGTAQSPPSSKQNLDLTSPQSSPLETPKIAQAHNPSGETEATSEVSSETMFGQYTSLDLPALVQLKPLGDIRNLVHPPLIPVFPESLNRSPAPDVSNTSFSRDDSRSISDRSINLKSSPNHLKDTNPEDFPESWSSLDELIQRSSSQETEANSWREMMSSLTALQTNSPEIETISSPQQVKTASTLSQDVSPGSSHAADVMQVQREKIVMDSPATTKPLFSTSSTNLAGTASQTKKVTEEDLERLAQLIYPWIQQQLFYEQERILGKVSSFPLWSKVIPQEQKKPPPRSGSNMGLIEPQTLMNANITMLSNEVYTLLRSRFLLERG